MYLIAITIMFKIFHKINANIALMPDKSEIQYLPWKLPRFALLLEQENSLLVETKE